MDVPSGTRRKPRISRISKSSKPQMGQQKRKVENSIVQCFVARPILVTCCNVMLFGVALWGAVPDSGSYTHVTLKSVTQSEFASTGRRLRSESAVTTLSSNQIASSQPEVIAPTATSAMKQQQQPEEQKQTSPKLEEATTSTKRRLSSRMETISPIPCNQQLADRKSDTTDPNQNLEESPHKHVTLTNPNMHISLHSVAFDHMRWSSIYNQGNYYETGVTEQFRSILQNTTKPGMVIDVGMNIGWFTIYSRAMGHKVAGFDPNPIMHTRLCESLQLNGWLSDNTVQSFAYGLGAEPAKLLFTTGKNPGKASFFEDRIAKRFRNQIEVPVVRLDDVADQQGWITNSDTPIYLWKLDVEGYEYHVLEGAQKLLHSRRVQNIILENSNTDVHQVVKMYTTIYNAGYEIKMLSNTNGDEIRTGKVDRLNKIFAEVSGDNTNGLLLKRDILYFTKFSVNIWWVLRQEWNVVEEKS